MESLNPLDTPAPMVAIERKVYKDSPEYSEYLTARFGENGLRSAHSSFLWQGHRWAYKHSSFDDTGDYCVIYRWAPAPQGAAPAASQDLDQRITAFAEAVRAYHDPENDAATCKRLLAEMEMSRAKLVSGLTAIPDQCSIHSHYVNADGSGCLCGYFTKRAAQAAPAPGGVDALPSSGLQMNDPGFEAWWKEKGDPGYAFDISEDGRRMAYLAAKAGWSARAALAALRAGRAS